MSSNANGFAIAGLVLNLIPYTNPLAIGDYLTYRAGTGISNSSRNIAIAKVAMFVLVFVSILYAGTSASACAKQTAEKQKDCMVGTTAKAGGAVGMLALSGIVTPILGLISIVFSIIAISQVNRSK